MLSGSGDGKSIKRGSARFSDGLISVSSPPQSRSSSAQDSYSTSATTYDEPADAAAAKPSADIASKPLKADGKGNVVVSVRVRPDAGGQEARDEWMVDGPKSLIGYHGKEGGDYYYGKFAKHLTATQLRTPANSYPQTMFSRRMMITLGSTTTSRNDSSAA